MDTTQKPKKGPSTKGRKGVGHPLKFPDLDKLKADINAYFDWCNPHIEIVPTPVLMASGKFKIVQAPSLTKQRPYTVSGLAYFLHTNRTTLLDYEKLAETTPEDLPLNLRARSDAELKEYTHSIREAKARCEGYTEERLMTGHPAGPIFSLKNNFANWKDQTEVVNPAEAEYHKQVAELRDKVVGRLSSVKKKKP